MASAARLEAQLRSFESRVKGVEDVTAKTVIDLKKVDDKVEQLRKELEAVKKKTEENTQSRDENLLTKEEYREKEKKSPDL